MRRVAEVLAGLMLGVASWVAAGALAASPPDAHPAGSGVTTPSEADVRAHADEVASYTLAAQFDPAKHDVLGEGTIAWRNTSRVPVSEIFLHLYLNAFKNQRSAYLRTPGSGFRGGALGDWGSITVTRLAARELGTELWPPPALADADGDETDVRVPLPRSIAPGEGLTLDVAFRAHLPSVALRTGHFGSFHMVAQWFPKIARLEPDGRWAHFPLTRFSEFYADFGAYDVTLDVPRGFVVAASGRRDRLETRADREVSHYVQRDVHDFAFAAWDGFREASREVDGVHVACFHPAGYERAAAVELEAAAFGLRHYGAAFGRYPYDRLTIVHPPEGADEAGGMEYPTLITTGGPWFLPWLPARVLEMVTLHELAHQWFYGLVATDEHRWPFLDEGLTSYAETDALEALAPGSSAGALLGLRVGVPTTYRVASLRSADDGPVARAADEFATGRDYGALVYGRTATLLTTLGRVYGVERVRGAVGRYARAQRFRHPGPDDLFATLGADLGPEAEAAARAVLVDGATFDVRVESMSSTRAAPPAGVFGDPEHPSPAPVDVARDPWIGEALVRRRGAVVLPVEVELTAADGTTRTVTWDARGPIGHLPYAGDAPLASVALDPRRALLLERDLLDDAMGGSGVVAPRVLELGSFAAGALVAAVSP